MTDPLARPLDEPLADPAAADPRELPDLRRLLVRTCVGLFLVFALVTGVGLVFREELVALGGAFVDLLGPFGVALGFFLQDAFAFPIPPDIYTGLALLGGVPFWTIVAYGSVGAMCGGLIGFFIGRRLSWTRWFRAITQGRGRQIHNLVERYGVLAVLIGAVSPLPYCLACWSAGALGMNLRPFILISLTRIPRIAFYLWLIELGFLSVV